MTRLYTNPASRDTPALIILLMDLSASMYKPFNNGQARSDYMIEGVRSIVKKAIMRSLKGDLIIDRYKFAAFGYSNEAFGIDIWHGMKGISDISRSGLPSKFSQPKAVAFGFRLVRDFLYHTVPLLPRESPAPMVIHFTDGEYSPGMSDPKSICDEIMQIELPDGHVLVETILCSNHYSKEEFDFRYQPESDAAVVNLVNISSVIPESYKKALQDYGEEIPIGTPLVFPIRWKNWTEIMALPVIS